VPDRVFGAFRLGRRDELGAGVNALHIAAWVRMSLREERKGMAKEYKMYIGGEWVDSASGKTFDNYDPYNGEVFARVAAATREDARRAIEAAAEAFPAWAATPPSERARYFLKAADILEARQQEVVGVLRDETGATFGWGMFQSGFTPGLLRASAAQVHMVTGEIIPADLPGAFFMTLRQPVGVVAGISPWNAPLILSLRAVSLPMAYGNTTVLKPSAESPISGGLIYAEIFEEAGLPAGVFNVVPNGPGHSAEVGDEMIENPEGTGREGGPSPEESRAGAGRKRPLHRPRGCGRRLRGQCGVLREVPAPGADLHVLQEDHRREAYRRRVYRKVRREGFEPEGWGPA
jgi:delta 1-pyrroline-5-carboxylate dehydrogenase